MPSIILIRGGGDLATGIALRLLHSGIRVVITELAQPLVVRRTVSFAEAIFAGEITVEGIQGRRITDPTDSLGIISILGKQQIPVIIDPECSSAKVLRPVVIVDARMIKKAPDPIGYIPKLYLGLGPGFEAGVNCQAVVETRRGHTLGRVSFQGSPIPDTGQPEGNPERVLRAPVDGVISTLKEVGDHCEAGEILAEIQPPDGESKSQIAAPFPSLLRGLIHSGIFITRNTKIGDVDPRDDPRLCQLVSDKALAVGGGVLEAILSKPEVRSTLWF